MGTGAVSILGLAWGTYRHIGVYEDPGFVLNTLSYREASILSVLGDWLIPPGDGVPGSGGDQTTITRIDSMLGGVPEQKRFLLSALPLAFEHGTLLFSLGSQRLTKMDEEERDAYLLDWAQSTDIVRCQLMAAVKALYGFGYFDREDVLKACGLPYFCGNLL